MLTQQTLTGPVKRISGGIQQFRTRENVSLLLWLLLLHYSLGYPFKFIYVLSTFSGMLLLLNTGKGESPRV